MSQPTDRLFQLTEFFTNHGFPPKEAAEKAQQQLAEENRALAEARAFELEIRKMEHAERMREVSLPSPRVSESVFVFGDIHTGTFVPAGTCFAISSDLLLTCQHNMEGRRITRYAFARSCQRINGEILSDFHAATVVAFNTKMDYAVLRSVDRKDLIPIPLSIAPVESDVDIKVFHVPIDAFNERVDDDSVSVSTRWIKSMLPTRHHMKCDGGLFAGSSGAPFVLRNGRAFGFHCESISSAKELDEKDASNAEIISATVNSIAHNHASFCRALLIGSCEQLVAWLREHGVVLHE